MADAVISTSQYSCHGEARLYIVTAYTEGCRVGLDQGILTVEITPEGDIPYAAGAFPKWRVHEFGGGGYTVQGLRMTERFGPTEVHFTTTGVFTMNLNRLWEYAWPGKYSTKLLQECAEMRWKRYLAAGNEKINPRSALKMPKKVGDTLARDRDWWNETFIKG